MGIWIIINFIILCFFFLNLSYNIFMADKRKTKKNNFNDNNLVDSLLSKGKKTKISLNNFSAPEAKNRVSFSKVINTTDNKKKIYGNNYKNSNGKNQIINNFHKAISSTKSDDIILKML